VLIAGDRDFSAILERARSMGIRTVLIHANNVSATRAIEAYSDFVFAGAWLKLLRMFSGSGSPEAGGGGGGESDGAAANAQSSLIQVETTAPAAMFIHMHRGLVASKLAAEVRLGNDEEDDDSDPANRLTIATIRVDRKAFVTVATPPTTSPTIRSRLAGALKAYLIGLDRSKRVVPLSGVTSDSLLNGNVKTELFQYAREKEAFFFIPRGAGNTTDEQGVATVIVVGHTPAAVAAAHQFLLKYERSSKTVPLSGSYVSGFVQRKMTEYQEEAARHFDVELEMVGEGRERSLVLTGSSPSVAKAEKWLTTTLKQIKYEKLALGDCALGSEDVERAIKMARRDTLAEIRSQDMVEGTEEDGATDESDDASTDSAPASATPSRFLISIFRPQQGQFIVCVGRKDHLQIAVDKVREMVLSVVRDTAAGLSPEAVRAHGLETPAGRKAFQQQFNLHSVFYDVARRRVTVMGPASEVQSAIDQVRQAENVTAYCYLADASLAGFYRSKPFQDELRKAIGTVEDVKVSTTHKDNSNVKKVVCLRGPKGAVEQLQPRVQARLDTLLNGVTDGLWHMSPAKFAFLKDEKEAVSGIARANKILVSFLDRPDAECVEGPPVTEISAPTQPKHYPLREGCVLEVVNVDMGSLDVGCLVNPANEKLMHGGGLARVISMAGGPIIEQESRAIVSRYGGRLKTGQVVHTSPGNLSQSGVQRLLHVVVPRPSEEGHVKLLGTAVAECLRQCDETPRAEAAAQGGGGGAVSRLASIFGGALGSRPPSAPVSSDAVDSIAFTLMGSGIYGWDEGTSARTILRAIKDYFSGARSGGCLKRVVIFDRDQHKWETAIHEADKTFGNGVLGLARRMVTAPAVMTPAPAPSTARPSLSPKPQPPAKPSHVFYWNNATGNARKDTGNCVWVPYDYDQCMAILNAEAAGQKNVHVTGDRIGQPSDTKNPDPETGRGEYVVHFKYQGTTHMVQTNRVTKWERLVMSKPVVTDADLPPLYDKALQRYHDALLAWGEQKQELRNWEKEQKAQKQSMAQGGGGGGGAAVVQEQRPASAPRPTKAVQLTGFAANVQGVKRALQQLLAGNTCEMEGEGILLPAFLSLDTVKEDIAAVLDQYEAEIVVAGNGVNGSSMLRVRALGEIARVRVAHHLQAAISREEKDVVPKGWVMREATPGKELNLVELAETDPEYQAAKARFLAHGFTCGGVTKIERVENPELYREYVTKRRLITAQLKEAGIADGGRTELVVHGTRTTSPVAVCGDINGLSPNYCERGMYGRAVYLAENTAYSDAGYAHDLGNGLHQLMLVEMVVGRIDERTAGDQNIKKPKDWHHTIAGPVGGNYRAYMKYEPYHTYPTHIITYRKK
jgi:O-acetyl-ADP-ribose deacetylase (regulator of RNase III)